MRNGLICSFLLVCLVGCGDGNRGTNSAPPTNKTTANEITLATTTSTQDTGLLDDLLPAFERRSGIKVKVVAVGSGQALELARRGDADVLLVHSPVAEQEFMDQGWGAKRMAVMHNDFVILGPDEDTAGIENMRAAPNALAAIAERQSGFVSRGDNSGTHKKEQELWKTAGLKPEGDWYISAGVGMAQALRIANEKRAYALSDRATYLAIKDELDLTVLFEGDDRLLNRYSVITLDPSRHPHLQEEEARRFAEYLVSDEGQKAIAEFGIERYGQPLFVPDAAP